MHTPGPAERKQSEVTRIVPALHGPPGSLGFAGPVVGFVLALWSTTGAMNAYMLAINLAYERKDRRSFVRKRIVALEMVGAIGYAFVLVGVLLIFGPEIERSIASRLSLP